MKETFVQIGFSGLRAPDGSFLPSVPIYIKVPAETVNPETGEYTGEDKMIREFSSMCLPYVKQYIEGGRQREAREKGGETTSKQNQLDF